MNTRMRIAAALIAAAIGARAQPSREWVIEAVGTERVAPDVFHVMMKMDYDAGLARDAAAGGEKRLAEFLAAVAALKIPELTWRVSNNVLTPAAEGMGVTYSRNVIFTLAGAPAAERDPVIARLEDIGARFNSHCVTCIGSG